MNEAYILLGSNIEPEKNILLALSYLEQHFLVYDVSHTWQTKPVGSDAADFLNTAVMLETDLDAHTLKEQCLCHIEELLGRVRQEDKNAPRTIDLDIIVFNGKVLDSNLFRYAHLILPFAELLPEYLDPETEKSLYELAEEQIKLNTARQLKHLESSI
ncbi:MAG: 2-amino-4-hydroxy-6-hydroxymethyldihydropteridine diphosphokinase [Chloroflexi bacterium HGW-Chloroflexi-4]|jgi:2-amino-4-hydroxy-6-hydroxymethyldihydropteridine diphosphokinase|nr:MAG: 2-amino-4-hydroxy-6-hydroxymethyldihydropteridine diphosphokinase [Chloroflexi bacterium HGW-Chloroflexi-4]